MKHQTLDQLKSIADINPPAAAHPMTRAQRIERWAELLERDPSRYLLALTGTEHLFPAMREEARAPGSPITIAFEDPLLRASGLDGDTFGAAKRFFGLSDWELHEVVCSCHAGAKMQAGWAAARVRRITAGSKIWAWIRKGFLAH